MRRICCHIVYLCTLLSCVSEGTVRPSYETVSGDSLMLVDLMVSVEGSSGHVDVRSILPEDTIEEKLSDITIASYDEAGVLTDVQFYTDLSDLQLYISKSGENTVFALANMGDMTDSFPLDIDDVYGIIWHVGTYDEVAEKGIPMCTSMTVTSSMADPVLKLVRLFAKVNLRILHTSLDYSSSTTGYAYNLCNESLYVRQANRRLQPFARNGSRAASVADVMSQSDYNPDLNDRSVHEEQSKFGPGPGYWQDTTIVVYVPENMQGKLLPVNDDPYEKNSGNISSVNGNDYSGLCTYIELNTHKEAIGTGISGGITYRCYLGADNVSDFNVQRNVSYDVTLDLTQESFGMDCWKVLKRDDWTDTRSLMFLDDSYVIYPGTSKDVFVHYNVSSSGTDSQLKSEDWTYCFDEETMAAAGLSYEFNPSVLKVSPDSKKNFCFTFTAAETASVGSAFPMSVVSSDGALMDEAVLYISQIGQLSLDWEKMPQYVAQYGIVNVSGAPDSTLPFYVQVSDPSVLSCTPLDSDSFRVVALRPGKTDLVFSNQGGSQTYKASLTIEAPEFSILTDAVALNPDGSPVGLEYSYLDSRGMRLSDFDPAAFRKYLLPVVSDNAFVSTDASAETVTMMIDCLYDDGKQINVGSSYELTLSAADCPGSNSQTIDAYVIDPFDDITPEDYGYIDDYTLFSMNGVHADVTEYFESRVEENRKFIYEAPVLNADKSCIESGLAASWTSGFSNPCEVWSVTYDADDSDSSSGASLTVKMGNVTSESRHSAGQHEVMLYVVNRHSQERIGHVCGYLDVYVHTVLGARAVFGQQTCNYRPAGSSAFAPTFADVYNDVAGVVLYYPGSGDDIYYMDVTAEFMTDVSKVYVFSRLLSGAKSSSDAYDAVSIIQPSVSDGQSDANTRLLYSVNGYDGDRLNVAGETYGSRKGIGVMLYRALRLQTYGDSHSDDEIEGWFLGVMSNGLINNTFAPCYDVHDMNVGDDMSLNKVSRLTPYYFAPSSLPGYVDDSGRGYHVIHFLEEFAPDTCGWINLL